MDIDTLSVKKRKKTDKSSAESNRKCRYIPKYNIDVSLSLLAGTIFLSIFLIQKIYKIA